MQQATSTSVNSYQRWRRHASTHIIVNVGIALIGVLIARILGSVLQILLARSMSVADFGLYTTLYTLLGSVVMITSLGLDIWLLRQGGSGELLDLAIGQVFGLRLIVTGALMIVAVLFIFVSGRAVVGLPVVFAALGLTLELLLTTAHTALRAQIRNRAAAGVQILVAGLSVTLIWAFWNRREPLLTATGYRLFADIVGLAIVLWLLWRNLRLIVWRVGRMVQIVRQASAFFVSDLLATVALKADLTMVALLIGAIGAGIYSPALTIINATFLVPTVVWQVLLPIVARQPTGSRGFRWTMFLVLAGSVLYGLIWVVVLGFGAEYVINVVFRSQYLDAVPLLRIMSFIPLLKSINFCWAMLMVARDRQVFRTKLLAVGATFNVVGNGICIPFFGLPGAAWINLVTEVVLLLCYSYGAWRTVYKLE